ncbi:MULTISPECIES: ABC transporter permease [unclassified Shinella]|uniref:ABC transporter permease n=1 Tax=unclassified Shinella TaxID=2643062 RepID=UPI00225D2F5D|nr:MULTISPECIES: ABC transporter permease [unclassified Shinella]CAI0334112.1 putative peptide transport system permease protein BAB2_1050 [Rhizobiaceae bacterium]CAK7261765.1 putative peptide transport system permease protein BAB2_1050 [Shinella sp. WSC3-e]MDC7259690.1 ABC transporter permease [Shinella sp. YE25]MDC7266869.1 ABC transporter permease [Shinella sp. HY16]MDC7273766.1 ABC transporter permease [Shinella sp. YZ44]
MRKIADLLIQTLPVVLIVSVVAFLLTSLLPGDAAVSRLGLDATPEQLAAVRETMGLNDPVPIRYVKWLGSALAGDLGTSLRSGEPVTNILMRRIPVTVELAVLGTTLAMLFGIPAGILAAVYRNGLIDGITNILALSGMAIPFFWLGLLLIMMFSLNLQWVPPSGYVPFLENPLENLRLMALPSLTIAVAFAATLMRQTRASMLEVLTADYIRTAKSKGTSPLRIILHHALRNALIPIITVVGLQMGTLVGGAIVTESVFGLPGLGRTIVEGIFQRDFPVVQGVLVVIVVAVVATNFVTDICYRLVNPRIK